MRILFKYPVGKTGIRRSQTNRLLRTAITILILDFRVRLMIFSRERKTDIDDKKREEQE